MNRAACLQLAVAQLIVAALASLLSGQEPVPRARDEVQPPRELRYFRVEVPQSHPDTWGRLGFGFKWHSFPIPRVEFDRLLRAANESPTSASPTAARIASSRGEATLRDDALVGRTQWEIVADDGGSSLLPLAPCNLAISAATWADGRAAKIGNTSSGSPVVVVESSGKLIVDWSLRGSRDVDDVLRCDMQLPRCQQAQLELRLPPDARVAASRGVLSELSPAGEGERRYALDLGSLSQTQLSLANRQQAPSGQSPWLVRQRCDYSISEQGITLATELSLDLIADSPAASVLKLQADAGLHLTSARVDGKPAELEVSASGSGQQVMLSLEKTASAALRPASSHKVLLTAVGEFPPAAARRLAALRPSDVVWQSSAATVTVVPQFELRAVDVSGGRLAKLSTTPAGTVAAVDFHDPSGRMTLEFGAPRSATSARSTYVWRIAADGIEGRCFTELTAESGMNYEIGATLAPGWEVEERDVRVFAMGADASLALVESRVTVQRGEIHVVFDEPLARQRSLQLEVTARCAAHADAVALTADELVFVQFPSQSGAAVGVATTEAPQRVQISGASRVAHEEIAPAALAWVPAGDAFSAFLLDAESSGLTVEIVRDPPRVEAEVEVMVDVDPQQLAETYEIHVRPDANGVDRLRVSFWPPRASPLEWSLQSTEELPVVEFRRVGSSDAAQDAPEIWEAKFHQRQTSPMVLRAQRTTAQASRELTPVTFASVDEATTQNGRVTIRSAAAIPVKITSRRLRSIAAGAAGNDAMVVRGAYRFDPARTMPAGDQLLSLEATAAALQAWAWQLVVESQLTATDTHAHRATWQVENDGASGIVLTMPPGSKLRGATINRQAIDAREEPGGKFALPLPLAEPRLEISVEYTTTARRLGVVGRIAAPVPTINIPVLTRRWRASLPEGYMVSNAPNAPTLGRRLFGSVLRSAPARVAAATAPRSGPIANPSDVATLVELALPASGEAKVSVHSRDFAVMLRLACLLVAIAVAWWATALRPSLLFGASLMAGCLAIIAPTPLDAAASGVFMGLVLGAALRWTKNAALAATPLREGNSSTLTTAARLGAMLPWCFGLAIITSHAAADDAPRDVVYPVWIPVNDKRVPSDSVYLPKEFYAELRARAGDADKPEDRWLLLRAAYQLRLAWQGSPQSLQAEELHIVYDLNVLESTPRIRLPLPYAGAALGASWATLDGQPIDVVWQPEQTSIEVPISEIGAHRLELHVQPIVVDTRGQMQFDLPIPPCAQAQLDVLAPPNAPAVQVLHSHGAADQHVATLPLDDGGEQRVARWRVALGGVDRLALAWPRQATSAVAPAKFAVDQMAWLKLSGEPRVEYKFRCAVQEGTLREVWMVAPADLKLAPSSTRWEPAASTSASTASYRLVLENPAEKEAVLRADFLLPSPVGVGRMLLPQVQLRDADKITRTSLALSLPSGVEVAPDASYRPLTVEDFARRWGETTATPAHTLQMDPAARLPQLLLRPAPVLPGSRETLLVGLARKRATLQFSAEIDPVAPPTQCYQLSTPPDFQIARISVTSAAAEQPQRELLAWWSSEAGKLRLFLQEPAAAAQRIEVEGFADLGAGRQELPMLRLSAANCAARRVELYRDASVLVEVAGAQGYTIGAQAEATPSPILGRPLATLIDDQPASSTSTCTLEVAANRPQISGRQVTRLLRVNDAWQVRVDLQLHVADGVVDELRLQWPEDFGPDLALLPALTHRITPGGDGAQREIVVVPPQPISGQFEVAIVAKQSSATGQVHVPDVRLRDAGALDRFVIVPRTFDTQNIQWEVDRLLALPNDRRQELDFDDPDTIAYRVASDPFRAELRAVRRLAGVPLVRLADMRFAWNDAANCAGWATFDVEPAGLNYCTVAVPAGLRIVHVRAGELAAQSQPLSPQRWRIALRPQGLPQRIEVLYEGTLVSQPSSRELLAAGPVLEDIAVQRTLWTIYGPASRGRGQTQMGGDSSPLQHDLQRLRALVELLRLPQHQRVESSARETRDWLAAWNARWNDLRQNVARTELPKSASGRQQQWLDELQDIDADFRQAVADLGVSSPDAASATADNTPDFWQRFVAPGQTAARAIVQGSSSSMRVAYPAPDSGHGLARYTLAALFGVAGLALLAAKFWLPAGDWQQRSGPVIGVVVGIVWAIWFSPWWVGFIIAIYFLLSARRPRNATAADSAMVVSVNPTGAQS